MTLTILDTKTGKEKAISSSFSAHWWAEGNGSCDCNRAIEMGSASTGNTCMGATRYLIIDADDDSYDYNSSYPVALVSEWLKPEGGE
ncbi:MAG: hypothetical protein GY943_36145 [Chloroflexi bacterium]|nr:hypothetical protein [Chloroflexota bacterium]